jgi:hypothetical protein
MNSVLTVQLTISYYQPVAHKILEEAKDVIYPSIHNYQAVNVVQFQAKSVMLDTKVVFVIFQETYFL